MHINVVRRSAVLVTGLECVPRLQSGLLYILGALMLCAISVQAQTNSLVYEGADGRLEYGTYANEGQVNAVNRVPDFSRCGYKGGGVPIPFVPTKVTLTPGSGDRRADIQAAINQVSAMPKDADGFRGAVLLKAGVYEVNSTLFINTDGVVLRGEGSGDTGGTKIVFTATIKDNLLEIKGSGSIAEVSGTRQQITGSFVPVGATSFTVQNASGFSVGDAIRIQNKINDKWLTDLGMEARWTVATFQIYHERVITNIVGNVVYIDAPIMQTIEDQYGGGDIFKYTHNSAISNIGVESLRLESTYAGNTDEQHGWVAVQFADTHNFWVRQVTARYFGYSCVDVGWECKYGTIEDCAMLDYKSIIDGGRRYGFKITRSSYILMQRCYTREGRHDFVGHAKTWGPNAFVDCRADNAKNDIGPHMQYSTGQLYDNIEGGEIRVQNRGVSAQTAHGWRGAQVMFWNCYAHDHFVCDAPKGAMSWAVGCIGTKKEGQWEPGEPEGIWESHGTHVTPRSLYYSQLKDRLGLDALQDVIIPDQDAGNIWTQLASWAGDGLFGPAVVAWSDKGVIEDPDNSVSIKAMVRDLVMLENGVAYSWSKVSGPGNVNFANASARETSASFSSGGDYVLRLTADDGATTQMADIFVTYLISAPPAVSNQDAVSQGPTTVELSGVLSSGGVADAWFCWGTTDGGTESTADWDQAVSVGTVMEGNSFSLVVTGLTENATYWYRCFVTNSAGTDWADGTESFSGSPLVNTGGGDPAPGADIYLDAGLGEGVSGTWEDSLGAWDLALDTSPAVTYATGVSSLPGISAAYVFPGGTSGDGGGQGASFQTLGWDTTPVTIELWFKPDSTSDDGMVNGQVLWETGGGTGFGIFYNDGTIEVGHDTTEVISSVDVSALASEFIQVVVSYDVTGTDDFELYINGAHAATGNRNDSDWSGSNGAGLGARGDGTVGGRGSGDAETESFEGMIAIFRAYRDQVLNADDVMSNYLSIAASGVIDNLPPGNLGGNDATLNAVLSAVSTNFDVYVHWGTTDGGTDANNWSYSSYVGGWTNVLFTNINYTVDSIVPGQTIFYAFRAENVSTNAWGAPSWRFTAPGTAGDQKLFTVYSAHGGPLPFGTGLYASNTIVNASLSGSPIMNGTTQYVCTGWIGTGSVDSGSGTNTSFTITTDSTLTWQWQTNYWIDLNIAGE